MSRARDASGTRGSSKKSAVSKTRSVSGTNKQTLNKRTEKSV